MEWLRQKIYLCEFLLVVVPAAFFVFLTFFLLVGYAGSYPIKALQLSVLWLGGFMGTYALWSMYVRLLNSKFATNFRELPYIFLICGVIANVVPVIYFLTLVYKLEQLIFTLLCLAPALVASHWVFALINAGNKSLTLRSSGTAQKRAAP